MINVKNGQLVFQKSGAELHQDVREGIESVAKALLKLLDLESLDLSTVSTKSNRAAGYPKFVLRHTLRQEKNFDENYVECMWRFYQTQVTEITPEQFYAVTLGEPGTEFAFRRAHVPRIRNGVGLSLLTLHCRGAIILPMCFDWPPGLAKAGLWSQELGLFSELLSFLRLLEPKIEELPHPAFMSVGTSQKRREWFLCYGTKLLLATGWLTPRDARMADLLTIKAAESQLGVAGEALAFKALIDVLRERYGCEFDLTVEDWSREVRYLSISEHAAAIVWVHQHHNERRGNKWSGRSAGDKGCECGREQDGDLSLRQPLPPRGHQAVARPPSLRPMPVCGPVGRPFARRLCKGQGI